jgi:uncharacterized protein YraI
MPLDCGDERIRQETAMTARWKTALLAASFLGLSAGVAAADPATVIRNAPLYAQPGGYVQAVIPAGSYVDNDGCGGAWCAVKWAGRAGYVSASLLRPAAGFGYVPDDDGPGYVYEPGYGTGYGYGARPRVHREDGRRRGNGQGNVGQPRGPAVQQRSQQNFRATTPRVHSQPAAGGRGAGGGKAAAKDKGIAAGGR